MIKARFKNWWNKPKTYANGSTFTRGDSVVYTAVGLVALALLLAFTLWFTQYLAVHLTASLSKYL